MTEEETEDEQGADLNEINDQIRRMRELQRSFQELAASVTAEAEAATTMFVLLPAVEAPPDELRDLLGDYLGVAQTTTRRTLRRLAKGFESDDLSLVFEALTDLATRLLAFSMAAKILLSMDAYEDSIRITNEFMEQVMGKTAPPEKDRN